MLIIWVWVENRVSKKRAGQIVSSFEYLLVRSDTRELRLMTLVGRGQNDVCI